MAQETLDSIEEDYLLSINAAQTRSPCRIEKSRWKQGLERFVEARGPRRLVVHATLLQVVEEIFERVVKAAEGAALGTETTFNYEVMHGNYPLMPNKTLSEVVNSEMLKLGGISYTKEEEEFAEKIYKTLINPRAKIFLDS